MIAYLQFLSAKIFAEAGGVNSRDHEVLIRYGQRSLNEDNKWRRAEVDWSVRLVLSIADLYQHSLIQSVIPTKVYHHRNKCSTDGYHTFYLLLIIISPI